MVKSVKLLKISVNAKISQNVEDFGVAWLVSLALFHYEDVAISQILESVTFCFFQ